MKQHVLRPIGRQRFPLGPAVGLDAVPPHPGPHDHAHAPRARPAPLHALAQGVQGVGGLAVQPDLHAGAHVHGIVGAAGDYNEIIENW